MRLLLADDHLLFMEALKTLLGVKGYDVVGTAQDGLEALEKARNLSPEVILMDIAMPKINGIEATRIIKAELPDIQIVMLTVSETDENLFGAIKSGASGYLLKTDSPEMFFELLAGLLRGEAPLSGKMAGRILEELAGSGRAKPPDGQMMPDAPFLTPRQIEVLTLAAQGLTYKEVGAKLFLSERTIKYHMGEIIRKLHLKNRKQAIAYARQMKFRNI